MGGPITIWMVYGFGTVLPLGMARSDPPMPIGTIGAPVRAERNAAPFHQIFDVTAVAARSLGKQDEELVLAQHLLGAVGAPRGRPTHGGPGRLRL